MSCPSRFNCPDCQQARSRPTHGGYRASCLGCRARALSRSIAGHNAIVKREPQALQDAIDKVHVDPLVRAEFRRAIWEWWRQDHPEQNNQPNQEAIPR